MVKKFYGGSWREVPSSGSSGLNTNVGGFEKRRSYVNRKGSTGFLGSSKGSVFVSTRRPKRRDNKRSRSAGFFRGGKRQKFGSGFR